MDMVIHVKHSRNARNIFWCYLAYLIGMYHVTSYLIDGVTQNHISYFWAGFSMCLMFWPVAMYSLYVALKAFPFSVYPADGTFLPFSMKQQVGLSAKLSGISGLIFAILFIVIPLYWTYSLQRIEGVSDFRLQLQKELKMTEDQLLEIKEKNQQKNTD